MGDEWGCDAHMVEGLFQIIEGMDPPWITLKRFGGSYRPLPYGRQKHPTPDDSDNHDVSMTLHCMHDASRSQVRASHGSRWQRFC